MCFRKRARHIWLYFIAVHAQSTRAFLFAARNTILEQVLLSRGLGTRATHTPPLLAKSTSDTYSGWIAFFSRKKKQNRQRQTRGNGSEGEGYKVPASPNETQSMINAGAVRTGRRQNVRGMALGNDRAQISQWAHTARPRERVRRWSFPHMKD